MKTSREEKARLFICCGGEKIIFLFNFCGTSFSMPKKGGNNPFVLCLMNPRSEVMLAYNTSVYNTVLPSIPAVKSHGSLGWKTTALTPQAKRWLGRRGVNNSEAKSYE